MERPIFQPIGTPEEELDTPALVVDLGVLRENISTFHNAFRSQGDGAESAKTTAGIRPHVSGHGCPEIARIQLAAAGDSGSAGPIDVNGIAVNTLGEAEVFAGAGFSNIAITQRVVTAAKLRRLAALAHRVSLSVAVDDAGNVQRLSEAATAAGSHLDLLVDIDAGYGFGGVAPGQEAVTLAQAIAAAPGLSCAGIMTYEGPVAITDPVERAAETGRRLQPALETLRLLERAGIAVAVVSAGSIYNHDTVANLPGVTEVPAGVYPLMDLQTCRVRPEFNPAARVLATVISHPVPGRAVVDAGHKTVGPDFGVPALEGFPGAVATRFSAEHGILELDGPATNQLNPNDKVRLVPYNLPLCVNQFDYIRAVSDGKLVGYWPVAARGRLD